MATKDGIQRLTNDNKSLRRAIDELQSRVTELEAREQRIREAAFHPTFNSMEARATIKTILTLG